MKDRADIAKIGHYIGGEIVVPEGDHAQAVYCPATGEQTGTVALA